MSELLTSYSRQSNLRFTEKEAYESTKRSHLFEHGISELLSGNERHPYCNGTLWYSDFATLTSSEVCSHGIGRYFDNKDQERAKT